MSKINSITVSSKVGMKVPEMVKKLTDAFKAVQADYCEDSVALFTETVKVIRLANKEVYNQIAGGEIASGLVGMMVKHDGSMIVKRPGDVTTAMEAINALYDTGVEVPSAETLWMEVATLITFVPEDTLNVADIEIDGNTMLSEADAEVEKEAEQLCSNNEESNQEGDKMSATVETTIKVTEEIKDPILSTEDEAKLNEAAKDFADTLRQIDIDITQDVKEFADKVKAKVKGEEESTVLEKVALGAAVGVGAVVVGAGVYYAYKAIFGNNEEMGDLI